jgi:hypothetical protein
VATRSRLGALASVLLLPVAGLGIGAHVQHDHRPTVVALSAADEARVEATVAAAGPYEKPYLLEAVAAGHSGDDLVTFARRIRGKQPRWLRRHLTLVDPSGSGWVTYRTAPVEQTGDTTCGSMTILMARAMTDPLYALYLTTGDSTDPAAASGSQFEARLAAEEVRIHHATNRFWPERLGSTPAGLSSELNRHVDALGTRYEPQYVTGGGGKAALRAAVAAVDRSQLVPVLIGDLVPRHFVLLIGRDGGDLLFYEPAHAAIGRISQQAFLGGTLDALGFHHVFAVVTPTT